MNRASAQAGPENDREVRERFKGLSLRDVTTYEAIADRCARVRAVLSERGVRLHRDSELAKLLRGAEQVARKFSDAAGGTSAEEAMRIAHADRIALAVLDVGEKDDAHECLRRMCSGPMDLAARGVSPGKDALWEVDLAAMLRRQGIACRMAEPPDLVLTLAGQPYPVACKAVHSEKGVEAQVRKGVKQLQAFGRPGVVALNIDETTPANSLYISPNAAAAGDGLAELNRRFLERHARRWHDYVRDGRLHAVTVTVNVVADLTESAPRINRYSQTAVWTLAPPHAPDSAQFSELAAKLQRLVA
jgi:hypothetical protein